MYCMGRKLLNFVAIFVLLSALITGRKVPLTAITPVTVTAQYLTTPDRLTYEEFNRP